MKKIFFLLAISLAVFSCNKEEPASQTEERNNLEKLKTELQNLSLSKECTDSSQWSFVSFGVKPCGSIKGYISYHKDIDTADFLKKVETYTKAERSYNEKWEKNHSKCKDEPKPKSVECKDGKPVFVY